MPLHAEKWLAKIEQSMSGAAKQVCMKSQLVAETDGYVIYLPRDVASKMDQTLANTIRQQLGLDRNVSFKSTSRQILMPVTVANSKEYAKRKQAYTDFKYDPLVVGILSTFDGATVSKVEQC